MRKVKYKPLNVNQLNWNKMHEKFNNNSLVFSIDVAKSAFVGLLSNEDQTIVQLIKWTHPEDTEAFVDHLHSSLGATQLTVVMEPTGTFGDALRWQFVKRDIPVYRVNPKHTHDQAETFDGVPSSHDAKAACIIADLHARGKSTPWKEKSIEQRDLSGLTKELDIYHDVHRSNLNRLNALLVRHWPEAEIVMDLNTVSMLTLLSTYGAPEHLIQNKEAAEELLRKASRGSIKSEKIQAIIASAEKTLGMPCSTNERAYIQMLATDLLRTRKACADVEKRMALATSDKEELTEVIGFCGQVTAVVLISVLGDLRQYASANSLLNSIGLNLKETSSGNYNGQLKITKRGSGKLRFYLYWLALRLIKRDKIVKAWYLRKVARDGGKKKGRAIVAVMRKAVKALWHVAKGNPFDSRKLFDVENLSIDIA